MSDEQGSPSHATGFKPAITLRQTIDRTAQCSRASSKSTSLELLLVMHFIVGVAELRR